MSGRFRRVALVGALGRMGERVRAALREHPELALGSALEAPAHPAVGSRLPEGARVTADPAEALAAAEVAIVFAPPAAAVSFLRRAAEAGVPSAVGTTGFSPGERREIEELARRIPLLLAPNFSVAVNVLAHLVARAAKLLGEDYDAEILELHHRAKRDAPSGTALRLGEAVAGARNRKLEEVAVFERRGETGPRPAGAIGLQTLRGGDNAGEHTVYFVGEGERLELTHRAATRDHFARGAVRAAAWLLGRPPGLYRMEEVLGLDAD